VLNSAAGKGSADETRKRLERFFQAAQQPICLVMAEDVETLVSEVRQALGNDVAAVVVCGGDGTIHTVAEVLIDSGIPLGVIPCGTLNHFAKDLGVPQEIEQAAEVVLNGRIARVDVAQVNGRTFLNNSSIGLYPRMLELRQQKPAKGLKKWAVAAWALAKELRKNRRVTVDVQIEGQMVSRKTPLVMVANNEYVLAGFEATTRAALDRGLVAVYIVKPGGALRLARLVWQILRGNAHAGDHMERLLADRVTIRPRTSPLPVAFDGETERMVGPLEYRSRPGALRVLVPANPA
jgi:YegS/Rv2252/BmrU family lipid kinase